MNHPVPGSLIARGRTAEVYAWKEGQILKLFYAWCPAHWAQHEMDISRRMATMSLPVPKCIDDLKIDERQGIIYERVDGPTMLELSLTRPWLLFRLARQLAELHSQVHEQDGSGLVPLSSSLKETIYQVEDLSPDLKNGAIKLLEELPEGNALCHFDFHPGQVILTTRGPVIIDWMTAYQGHPFADVARTLIILKVSQPPGAGWAMRQITNRWRGLFYRTYLARYLELHPGVKQDEITTWMIPVAAARLKEAIPGEREPLLRMIQLYSFR